MKNRKNLNQFKYPMKLQPSTFHWIEVFPDGQEIYRANIYDDIYENYEPSLDISGGILVKAQAENVFQLTMDFNPSPFFTLNKSGYLKLFLHPDHSVLGKIHFDLSSSINKENLSGKYFLVNEYIYLELKWESKIKNRTFSIWGWADLATGSFPKTVKQINKNKKI